jgi:hypothetical protein
VSRDTQYSLFLILSHSRRRQHLARLSTPPSVMVKDRSKVADAVKLLTNQVFSLRARLQEALAHPRPSLPEGRGRVLP